MQHEFQDQMFSTKLALAAYIEERVSALPLNTHLTDDDLVFALELLHRRPSAASKIGPGVANVWLVPNGQGRGFLFRRTDGLLGDFSWRKATTAESSTLSRVAAAMRYAVKEETQRFRTEFFARTADARCSITGVPLDPETAEVDHVVPFWQLRDRFIDGQGGLAAIKFSTENTNFAAAMLADRVQITEWREFHARHAELRMTTAEANRKRGGDVAA